NNFGQLGNNTTTNTTAPTSIDSGTWSAISAGQYHSLGIKNSTLYAWGGNNYGQLGTTTNSGTANRNPTPILLDSGSTGWSAIAAGLYHSLGIKNGQLYAWGYNYNGQLGTTTNSGTTNPNPTPILLDSGNTGWTAIAAGFNHSLGIKNGVLYAWGVNQYGQLGTTTNSGTTTANSTPIKIDSGNTGWSAIAVGQVHSLGIKSGVLYAWGSNSYGQLGTTTNSGVGTANPTPIKIDSGSTGWTAIAGGQYHSLGIKSGVLYAWGRNNYGQLGTTTNSGTGTANPTPIKIDSGSTSWTSIAGGQAHSLGIKNSTLYAWGLDSYGQLGNSTSNSTPNSTPIKIGSDTWTKIAAGAYHSLGIRT
ncbi:MAG: hypothetical protein QM571_03085, partial [Micrococcaceae bacterium]